MPAGAPCYNAPVPTSAFTGFIDQIVAAARGAFAGARAEDAEKTLRAALQGLFSRLDLVTREEFEIQQQVLLRTRALLEQLEKHVAALEQKLNEKQ